MVKKSCRQHQGRQAMLYAAKTLAMTAADLLTITST
jgi:hypothetical protein